MIIPRKYVEIKENGKITIPKSLLDYVGLKGGEKIALCAYEEYGEVFIIKPFDKIDSLKVVDIVYMDQKRRFTFPMEFLSGKRTGTVLEIYILDGDLIIEEVNV